MLIVSYVSPTSDIPRYSAEKLTQEQAAASRNFKEKTDAWRFPEWRILELVLPKFKTYDAGPNQLAIDYEHPSLIMTEEDVITLLGEPSNKKDGEFMYYLGWERDSGHWAIIKIKNGMVFGNFYMVINP